MPPYHGGTPHIDRVTVTPDEQITVVGSGFGRTPQPVPFSSNEFTAFVGDLAYHSSDGQAPSVGFVEGDKWSDTKLVFEYWSNTRIVIAGLGGQPPPHSMFVLSGDPMNLVIWNQQNHLATAWGGFAQ